MIHFIIIKVQTRNAMTERGLSTMSRGCRGAANEMGRNRPPLPSQWKVDQPQSWPRAMSGVQSRTQCGNALSALLCIDAWTTYNLRMYITISLTKMTKTQAEVSVSRQHVRLSIHMSKPTDSYLTLNLTSCRNTHVHPDHRLSIPLA